MTPLKQAARTAERASTIARLDKPLTPRAKIVRKVNTKMLLLSRAVQTVDRANIMIKLHKQPRPHATSVEPASIKIKMLSQAAKTAVPVNTLTKVAKLHVRGTHAWPGNILQI